MNPSTGHSVDLFVRNALFSLKVVFLNSFLVVYQLWGLA